MVVPRSFLEAEVEAELAELALATNNNNIYDEKTEKESQAKEEDLFNNNEIMVGVHALGGLSITGKQSDQI